MGVDKDRPTEVQRREDGEPGRGNFSFGRVRTEAVGVGEVHEYYFKT